MIRAFLIFALLALLCRDHRYMALAVIFGAYAFILFLNLMVKLHSYLTRKL